MKQLSALQGRWLVLLSLVAFWCVAIYGIYLLWSVGFFVWLINLKAAIGLFLLSSVIIFCLVWIVRKG